MCGRGIEVNRGFLSRCRERELEVAEGDGLTHLRTLPPASLGGVTAFRVIEYLPLATLAALLDEVVRVLKPGGLALFETPNPQFLLVSSLFHADPTHQRLLTPETLQFLAQQRGLTRVEVQTLNERVWPQRLGLHEGMGSSGKSLPELLKQHLQTVPDYAVVGWKP